LPEIRQFEARNYFNCENTMNLSQAIDQLFYAGEFRDFDEL
jgi:hypothetical protein